MTCVEIFKHRDAAKESQRLLKDQGLDARVVVDPMEGLYPALATYVGVVLLVPNDQVPEARRLLRHDCIKKAS